MALRGHTFKKQLFSSECFALFIDTFLGKQSGIVKGCSLSYTENSITINNGYFCIQGRFLEEAGGSTFNIETAEQDTYCKLICEIDLSKENTTSILNQATYKIITDTTDYPVLIKGDIADTATVYQYEFARFKNTEEGIKDFRDTREFLDFNSLYSEIRQNVQNVLDDIESKEEEFFVELRANTKEEVEIFITDLNEYLESIKDILDEDTAGHLLLLIQDLQEKFDKEKPKTFNIANTEWTLENDTYTATISDNSITVNSMVDLSVNSTTYSIAEDAGMKAYADEVAGGLKLYADSVPSGTISGKYCIK